MPSGPGLAMFDRRIEAPIGIAAGPLLNSRWVEAYARLGYGLLTYKTVRSRARPSYSLPNWVFLREAGPGDGERPLRVRRGRPRYQTGRRRAT